jgi:anti-sigma B factor antagonist
VVTIPRQRANVSSSDLLSVTTTWPRAGLAVVTARGEVDAQTKAELEKEVADVMNPPFPRRLVVDLDGVGFIGAAGLQVILALSASCRDHATELSLVSTSRPVLRAIEVSGLGRTLEITGYPASI